ncbi:hypothetical protein CDD82_5170 [Ophiocordyceps australis]|uniref:Patatin-like phospholipase domain-containing protein n=1 Tax=Ophiocordyceps australis TaxID=1399860 RepID=A0A2C5Z3P1_9HYPO|nr:hypothetical protein CDD82_5170 [Ophiocordyceps australis]
MAQTSSYGFPPEAFDASQLPDAYTEFLDTQDLKAFEHALQAPDPLPTPTDEANSPMTPKSITKRYSQLEAPMPLDGDSPQAVAGAAAAAGGDLLRPRASEAVPQGQGTFITAQNDWAPVNSKIYRGRKGRRKGGRRRGRSTVEGLLGTRTKDETREGYLYQLLKWPLLLFVFGWLLCLSIAYLATRWYIWGYEHFFAWRGRRETLRRNMRQTCNYQDWVSAARKLDRFLGREQWREEDDFAYYDSKTVKRVWEQLRQSRLDAEAQEGVQANGDAIGHVRVLVEACVKNNFVGVENSSLYSQTYYGTKNLVQNFSDEVMKSLEFLLKTKQLNMEEKRLLFKHVNTNFGRTALCLSGGASFAYYHFGVVRALLDQDVLPHVITGTSGGALIAALVATRTNEELKQLIVPALATRINACSESIRVWFPRWWRTGARFDSVDWAARCSWWTRGSMTFREAFERTGRILNVTCVPADAHSPTILCNYLTSPDCVIWSAVLASAAVPGILNPVVLMSKTSNGTLAPYSFGHKWKDGSLRTDIPIKALNTQFNVNFTIVSQVNPHINLFFFSSRGSVGHPVTHRKGRGWRGGYLMSAVEHYIKLDMNKWLRFVRHAELLPRPLGQDWSQLWLQQFSGTVTIWPKCQPSDFLHILSDPDPRRLARMIDEGRQSTFPKIKFVANRLGVERLVEQGRRETRPSAKMGDVQMVLSDDGMHGSGQEWVVEEETTTEGEEVMTDEGNNRWREKGVKSR